MQIRRLKNSSDLKLLEELNTRNEDVLVKNYPLHNNWIKKAIKDIEIGDRIALGVYDGNNLIGSVIIKFGLSNDIELKNFIVAKEIEDKTEDSDVNEVRELILEHVAIFCQKNGYEICNIDLATNDLKEINFFLNNNFKVANLRTFNSKNKPSVYSLTKSIDPIYNQDPLDTLRMVHWILSYNYNFQNVTKSNGSIKIEKADLVLHKFKFEVSATNIKPEFSIKGEAIIDEISERKIEGKEIDLINKEFSGQVDLKLFFTTSGYKNNISNRSEMAAFGIKYYGLKDIKSILGKESSVNKIPFSRNDIGGLLFFFDERMENIIKKSTETLFSALPFLLYLIDGYGNALKQNSDYIFFCKYDNAQKDVILWGASQILGKFSGSYQDVERTFRTKSKVVKQAWGNFQDNYDEKDWNFYTSYLQGIRNDSGIISEITVLNLQPIKRIKEKINPTELLSSVDINKYILDELNEFIIDTSYIDSLSANNILAKINSHTDLNKEKKIVRSKKIFFSYSKNERLYRDEIDRHLTNLKDHGNVETWFDGLIDPGGQWDEEIKINLENSDIILCLLSPSFMANKYIWEVELEKAKEKIGLNNIIPIFISKVDFSDTILSERNGLLTTKHLPPNHPIPYYSDNGIIWIAAERHEQTRDLYYGKIIEQLRPIISK